MVLPGFEGRPLYCQSQPLSRSASPWVFNNLMPMFYCVFIVCCAVCFRLLKHFITCTGMTSWTHSTCVAFYKNRFKAIGNGIRRNKSMGCLGFGFRIGRYEQEWDTICEMCDFDCTWPRWKVKYICVCDWIWSMWNVKCMSVIKSMSMWNVTSMIMVYVKYLVHVKWLPCWVTAFAMSNTRSSS